MKGMRKITPLGLRLPPDLREWIEKQAEANYRSLNAEIVRFLEDARRQHQDENEVHP